MELKIGNKLNIIPITPTVMLNIFIAIDTQPIMILCLLV